MKYTTIILLVASLMVFVCGNSVYAQESEQKTEQKAEQSGKIDKKGIQTVKLQTTAHSDQCKEKIENTLALEKGVVSSELDPGTQVLTVKFKPAKTDVTKIITVINTLGHKAKEIPTEDENLDKK